MIVYLSECICVAWVLLWMPKNLSAWFLRGGFGRWRPSRQNTFNIRGFHHKSEENLSSRQNWKSNQTSNKRAADSDKAPGRVPHMHTQVSHSSRWESAVAAPQQVVAPSVGKKTKKKNAAADGPGCKKCSYSERTWLIQLSDCVQEQDAGNLMILFHPFSLSRSHSLFLSLKSTCRLRVNNTFVMNIKRVSIKKAPN